MMPRYSLPLIGTLLLLSPHVGHADIVYSQPALYPGIPFPQGSAARSFTDPVFGKNYQTYDNFVLGTASTIVGVNWQGIYFAFLNPTVAPAPTATGFLMDFYADNSGLPGALLSSVLYSVADVHQTFVSNAPYKTSGGVQTESSVFDYSLSLNSPFAAASGTKYWLSIVAQVAPSYDPSWAWTGGTGPDGLSIQDTFGEFYRDVARPYDRAFDLTEVPEPTSVALLATAVVVGWLLSLRRFRKR